MRLYISVLAAALAASLLVAVGESAAPSSSKRASSRATKKKKRSKAKTRPAWRPSQQAPTPERYKEIQQALMQKGYLKGAATGIWDAESVQAMKRFQLDQNLAPTGKPSALALIALGLGPKREPKAQNGQADLQLPPRAEQGAKP